MGFYHREALEGCANERARNGGLKGTRRDSRLSKHKTASFLVVGETARRRYGVTACCCWGLGYRAFAVLVLALYLT